MSAFEETAMKMRNDNIRDLSQINDELHIGALIAELSEFQDSVEFKEHSAKECAIVTLSPAACEQFLITVPLTPFVAFFRVR
jgi:hypothetical protein